MSFSTRDSAVYYDELDFPYYLLSYAEEQNIRLGDFVHCYEYKHINAPSAYSVCFERVSESGSYEYVHFIVTTNSNGSYHYSFTISNTA